MTEADQRAHDLALADEYAEIANRSPYPEVQAHFRHQSQAFRENAGCDRPSCRPDPKRPATLCLTGCGLAHCDASPGLPSWHNWCRHGHLCSSPPAYDHPSSVGYAARVARRRAAEDWIERSTGHRLPPSDGAPTPPYLQCAACGGQFPTEDALRAHVVRPRSDETVLTYWQITPQPDGLFRFAYQTVARSA